MVIRRLTFGTDGSCFMVDTGGSFFLVGTGGSFFLVGTGGQTRKFKNVKNSFFVEKICTGES